MPTQGKKKNGLECHHEEFCLLGGFIVTPEFHDQSPFLLFFRPRILNSAPPNVEMEVKVQWHPWPEELWLHLKEQVRAMLSQSEEFGVRNWTLWSSPHWWWYLRWWIPIDGDMGTTCFLWVEQLEIVCLLDDGQISKKHFRVEVISQLSRNQQKL